MHRRLALVLVPLLWALAASAATPPSLMNYQGVLRDASDAPLDGSYDMVFHFYDASTAGNEILRDRHLTVNGQAVQVTGGLFSVAIGSGEVQDGTGPGTYTSLADVFRDYGQVWLEIQIGAETLAPRTQVQASAYALNASNLGGRDPSGYVDTTATDQTKLGGFSAGTATPKTGSYGIQGVGTDSGGYFRQGTTSTETWIAINGYGAQGYGPTAGGFFKDITNNAYSYVGYQGFGIRAYGSGGGGYFSDLNSPAEAYLGEAFIGVKGYGSSAGGLFQDSDSSGYGYVGYGDTGVEGHGSYAGGFFANTGSAAQTTLAPASYGITAYGPTAGGVFSNTISGTYAYIGYDISGMQVGSPTNGGGQAGFFTNRRPVGQRAFSLLATDNDSVNGGPFGIKAVVEAGATSNPIYQWAGDFDGYATGVFARLALETDLGGFTLSGNSVKDFEQNDPYDADRIIQYSALEGDEVGVYTRGSAKLSNGEAHVPLGETFAWVTDPDIGLTAQVTARGSGAVLYVASVSPTEIVVKSAWGDPDAEFDYIVHGLRIGFEEFPVLRDKGAGEQAPIPDVKHAAANLAKRPDLYRYAPLPRFKRMAAAAGRSPEVDLSRAHALRDAIGVYDAQDPKWRAWMRATVPAMTAPPRPSRLPSAGPTSASGTGSATASATIVAPPAERPAVAQVPACAPTTMPVRGAVEAGQVLVLDRTAPGFAVTCASALDTGVVGVALAASGPGKDGAPTVTLAPPGTILLVEADASQSAIAVGDLLTTSPDPGHAMRAIGPADGAILGKALEPLASGTGRIKVLIAPR